MTRKPTWELDLHNYLQAQVEAPFEYGVLDCCLFACDCVFAQTGVNMAPANLRGRYKTLRGALRIVKQLWGIASVEKLVEITCRRHGLAEIPVAMAQRGDIVLWSDDAGLDSIGIISMHGTSLTVPMKLGLGFIPREHARRAWAVGDRHVQFFPSKQEQG